MDLQTIRESAKTFDPRHDEKSPSERFDELFSWKRVGGVALGVVAGKPLEMLVVMGSQIARNVINERALLHQFPVDYFVRFWLYCLGFFVLATSFIYWYNIKERLQKAAEAASETTGGGDEQSDSEGDDGASEQPNENADASSENEQSDNSSKPVPEVAQTAGKKVSNVITPSGGTDNGNDTYSNTEKVAAIAAIAGAALAALLAYIYSKATS